MLHTIAVPIRMGRPTTILGLSIGPLHGHRARWWTRRTLRACRHVVVRETLSAEYLRGLGVVDNVLVAPDLAFLTEPSRAEGAPDLLPAGRWIAVTIVNWDFPRHPHPGRALARYVDVLEATLVAGAAGLGLVPVLVAQVTAQHHGRGDEALLSELFGRLRAAGVPARLVTEDLTPAQLSFLYGQCEVMLASRLHSAILAACAGTPPVAIGYQGFKTAGIMGDLGMEPHAHAIETVTAEALLTSIGRVVTDRTTLAADIRRRVESFRREIHDVVGRVVTVPPTPSGQAGEAWAATISSRMAGTS